MLKRATNHVYYSNDKNTAGKKKQCWATDTKVPRKQDEKTTPSHTTIREKRKKEKKS